MLRRRLFIYKMYINEWINQKGRGRKSESSYHNKSNRKNVSLYSLLKLYRYVYFNQFWFISFFLSLLRSFFSFFWLIRNSNNSESNIHIWDIKAHIPLKCVSFFFGRSERANFAVLRNKLVYNVVILDRWFARHERTHAGNIFGNFIMKLIFLSVKLVKLCA